MAAASADATPKATHMSMCSKMRLPFWQAELQLPKINASVLQRCTRRRGAPLSACTNLVPTGTGSTSLKELMLSRDMPLTHHKHERRIDVKAPAACYIMTLRDPADRLQSLLNEQLGEA